ncbi:SCAR family protein 4 [Striga asiatica]|uniref:SCAR family protein 4 n=1 Tax=Striga asiatica TaxID=4170 RepID=A0A5A7Q5Z9_STRAF|nr:SCAR family protein 4 [Striga asiatica]
MTSVPHPHRRTTSPDTGTGNCPPAGPLPSPLSGPETHPVSARTNNSHPTTTSRIGPPHGPTPSTRTGLGSNPKTDYSPMIKPRDGDGWANKLAGIDPAISHQARRNIPLQLIIPHCYLDEGRRQRRRNPSRNGVVAGVKETQFTESTQIGKLGPESVPLDLEPFQISETVEARGDGPCEIISVKAHLLEPRERAERVRDRAGERVSGQAEPPEPGQGRKRIGYGTREVVVGQVEDLEVGSGGPGDGGEGAGVAGGVEGQLSDAGGGGGGGGVAAETAGEFVGKEGSRVKSHESMQEPGGIVLGAIVRLSCFRSCTSEWWVAEWVGVGRRRTAAVIVRNNVRR